MTDELTSTGLTIDDALTRRARTAGLLRAAISSKLDLSEDQPWGQLLGINNENEQSFAELLQEIYSGIDPDQATGQTLDAVCSITGTYRRAATAGTVTLTLTFSAAATVPAGSQVSDGTQTWTIDADVVATGAGTEDGTATCDDTGSIEAPIGTLTTIVTPVANWTSVTNAAAAAAGLDRETDTELRLRREVELATGGSTSVDAIQAAVSPIEGVLEAVVYENESWRAVAPMPPHSVEVVFWTEKTGADLTALEVLLAAEIFEEKAGGIQAYGTTETTHTDTQGNDHQIGTTLATENVLELEYTLVVDGDFQSSAVFTAQVASELGAILSIGGDVYVSKLIDLGFNVTGVVNISQVRLRVKPSVVWLTTDITIGSRQIATIAAGDITTPGVP